MDKVQELLIKMLKRNDFFKELDDELLLKFADLFKLDIANKGQAIIIEGHNPDYVFILKKGKLLAKKANGLNSIVLGEIKEGEVFGEMSFFYNKPAIASVIVEEDNTSFWKIKKEDFKKFIEDNPILQEKINTILKKREEENKGKLGNNPKQNIETNDELDDIVINL